MLLLGRLLKAHLVYEPEVVEDLAEVRGQARGNVRVDGHGKVHADSEIGARPELRQNLCPQPIPQLGGTAPTSRMVIVCTPGAGCGRGSGSGPTSGSGTEGAGASAGPGAGAGAPALSACALGLVSKKTPDSKATSSVVTGSWNQTRS